MPANPGAILREDNVQHVTVSEIERFLKERPERVFVATQVPSDFNLIVSAFEAEAQGAKPDYSVIHQPIILATGPLNMLGGQCLLMRGTPSEWAKQGISNYVTRHSNLPVLIVNLSSVLRFFPPNGKAYFLEAPATAIGPVAKTDIEAQQSSYKSKMPWWLTILIALVISGSILFIIFVSASRAY